MNGFQFVGIGLALTAAMWAARAASSGRIGRGAAAAWIVLWGAAGTAIARPDLTVAVARLLGISRGADLVLYLSILGMIGGFFFVYLRLKRVESSITELVREIAIHGDGSDGEDR